MNESRGRQVGLGLTLALDPMLSFTLYSSSESVRFILRCLCVPLLAGGLLQAEPSAPLAAPDRDLVEAWTLISQLDYQGAHLAFSAYLESHPGSRDARLGWAMAQLNRPPKTNSRTEELAAMIEQVRIEAPDDDLGILAAYQLARLQHVHLNPPNLDEAARRYREIADAHPQHFLGQMSLLRFATIDLFAIWPAPDADERVARWEARIDGFTDPMIRRNFLCKLGDAILWFDLPPKRALPYFTEAQEIGFSRFDYRTLMMLRIYNISEEEGLTDVTKTVIRRYLQEFPRDLWSQFMRERLAELEKEDPS